MDVDIVGDKFVVFVSYFLQQVPSAFQVLFEPLTPLRIILRGQVPNRAFNQFIRELLSNLSHDTIPRTFIKRDQQPAVNVTTGEDKA